MKHLLTKICFFPRNDLIFKHLYMSITFIFTNNIFVKISPNSIHRLFYFDPQPLRMNESSCGMINSRRRIVPLASDWLLCKLPANSALARIFSRITYCIEFTIDSSRGGFLGLAGHIHSCHKSAYFLRKA